MNGTFIKKAGSLISKAKLGLVKRSPEILIAVGVVGTVAGAVLACRATTKVSAIIEKANKESADVHEVLDDKERAKTENYTEEDGKKDLLIIRAHEVFDICKLYAPAVILGALSLGCIITSNKVMRRRNAALGAAYAIADKSYKELYARVKDKLGEAEAEGLKLGLKQEKIAVEEVDKETGEVKKVEKTVSVADGKKNKGYVYFFDKNSREWTSDMSYNMCFLRGIQTVFNDRLDAEGYVFLNDILHDLDIDISKEGQIVGWMKHSDKCDGYIDFRMKEVYRENKNGVYERAIMLDFNVDGNVLDRMPD